MPSNNPAGPQCESELATKLAAFAQFNPNPVLEFSKHGSLSYWNEATMTMVEALGAEHPVQILPPDTDLIIQQCLATGQSRLRVESRLGGRVVSWSFFPIRQSQVVHCYAGDITERKLAEDLLRKAHESLESRVLERTAELTRTNQDLRNMISELNAVEKALSKAEAKYRSIFEQAIEGIYQSTPDGRYLSVNPALARMYGYGSPNELIATISDISAEIYLAPETRLEFKEKIEKEGKVQGLEYQVRRKDGQIMWVCESARSVKDEAGCLLYYEGTIQDITERKSAEAEKEQLEAQLRQARKLEAIGTLAGGIAHDFNNILAAILGFTELSLREVSPASSTHHNLRQVLEAANRAKDLVRQVLTFSRKDKSERKRVSLDRIIRECLTLLRASLPSTIQIDYLNAAVHDTILADASQIHQVIINLGANAGYAMRERGGQLTLRLDEFDVRKCPERPDEITAGPYLKLTVRDTGHGMPPEILDKIFTPFFTTKPIGEGTGLGLAVVHGIITRQGGRITVESQPELGTTFTLLLSKAPPSVSETSSSEEAGPSQLPGRGRILFVDDERLLVNLMEQWLPRWGYEVVGKTSSVEALALFRDAPEQFDLIITDQTLPALSGIDLAKAIKSIRPEIPMILCTGYSADLVVATETVNFNALLIKPVSFQQLNQTIHQVLSGARPIGPS
jgi:PAS domain S-box-containing protein